MALVESREKKNYISISSEGILRKVVPEGTPGAKVRVYETKEKDAEGNFIKASKLEKTFESVSGMITDISFKDTDYGTLLQVTLTDEFLPDEPEILSMSTSQSFAQDFMKKLPNIKLDKEVIIKPFAFTPEGAKRELKGLTIIQEGAKIEKSFSEKQEDGTFKNTMGFPEPEAKLATEKNEMKRKEGWKRYFKDVEIFLVDYTTEHFVGSGIEKEGTLEIVPEEIPFDQE
jgi:hypothetical protein